MQREVRWERMFVDQLEASFADKPVVYFTYGLCEPHGLHNTLGLDGLKVRAIAIRSAHTHGGIVAPADYWHIHETGGYATWAAEKVGEHPRKWLTAVPPWVHFKNVCYQIRAAEVIGFKAAILLTGHYGLNWKDLKTLIDLIQPFVRIRLYGLPDFEANVPGFDNDNQSGGDHAGKVETSLLAALEPECVDMTRMPDVPNPPTIRTAAADITAADITATETAATDTAEEGGAGTDDSASPAIPLFNQPPYFGMGPNAGLSDRQVGERMVDDEVAWLGRKADELLSDYSGGAQPGLATFEAVEQFWDTQVKPQFPTFETMNPDYDGRSDLSADSIWSQNAPVPNRS